jgi:DNA-binding XRE family transcriptional regulator
VKAADVLILAEVRQSCASGLARQLREAAKITRGEVAGAVGVTGRAIGLWETGQRSPTGEAALAYGRLLRQLARQGA